MVPRPRRSSTGSACSSTSPGTKHLCFDTEPAARRRARDRAAGRPRVRTPPGGLRPQRRQRNRPGHRPLERHPRRRGFIDELVLEAKRIAPDCLCTSRNYPTTEFLHRDRWISSASTSICTSPRRSQALPGAAADLRRIEAAGARRVRHGLAARRRGAPGELLLVADRGRVPRPGWPARSCSASPTTGSGAGARSRTGRLA